MTSQKLRSHILLLTILIIFPFFKGFAQTDDQSNGVYYDVYVKKSWENLDKNEAGQFSENENKRIWKRLKKLDITSKFGHFRLEITKYFL